jgi:uncharacterized protein (DUF2164 family)
VSDLITHTARLVPYAKRPKQVPSFVIAYSYEPFADEPGSDLGNLYVVMEVLVSGRASEEVADLVIETIGDHYYNQPLNAHDPLAHFEAAIKAVNHELSDYVNKGNAAWIGKISTAIAIQVGNEVHVSQTGSAETFLYRGRAATQISTKETNRPSTPNKTFGSIASGQLEPGDRLLLATPALIHQIPLEKLRNIISNSGPNAAISEITELLKGASVERIAALIIEITTPEIAALQVRSDQPDEIKLGSPENALEAAKVVAAPIAQNTITQSKKVVSAAQASWHKAKPQAKATRTAATQGAKQLLSTKGGRKAVLITIVVLAILGLIAILHNSSVSKAKKTFDSYQDQYQKYLSAEESLSSGSNTIALSALNQSETEISSMRPEKLIIDKELRSNPLPINEPRTYDGLLSLVSSTVDTANGLVRAQPIPVASLMQNSRPQHFELFDGKAYIFDKLSIVDTQTGAVENSSAQTGAIGNIVATTLSSSDDGIFIYTSSPGLWFYQFSSASLIKESVNSGQWPKASGIASYASNIYLLGDDTIYKIEREGYGYSLPISYLNSGSNELKAATGIAVDGSIYVFSADSLSRFVDGALSTAVSSPMSLANVVNLRSTANGSVIVGTSLNNKRIAVWLLNGKSLTFSKQVSVNNANKIYDATYDPNTGNIYATIDHRIVRFPIQP